MSFLDQTGVAALWAKAKASFAAKIEVVGATITIKNKAATPTIISQATIPDATTSEPGVMTATDKTKLDGISAGANKTIVDASLSSASENPVQSKAVLAALDGKLGKTATAAAAARLATARAISLTGDVTGSANFDGSAAASIAATIAALTAGDIESMCPAPTAGEEPVFDATPPGIWLLCDTGLSPAALFGGTWAMRTDTYLFMGVCIWRRVS